MGSEGGAAQRHLRQRGRRPARPRARPSRAGHPPRPRTAPAAARRRSPCRARRCAACRRNIAESSACAAAVSEAGARARAAAAARRTGRPRRRAVARRGRPPRPPRRSAGPGRARVCSAAAAAPHAPPAARPGSAAPPAARRCPASCARWAAWPRRPGPRPARRPPRGSTSARAGMWAARGTFAAAAQHPTSRAGAAPLGYGPVRWPDLLCQPASHSSTRPAPALDLTAGFKTPARRSLIQQPTDESLTPGGCPACARAMPGRKAGKRSTKEPRCALRCCSACQTGTHFYLRRWVTPCRHQVLTAGAASSEAAPHARRGALRPLADRSVARPGALKVLLYARRSSQSSRQ